MPSPDRGARYARHWTASENAHKPEDASVLAAKRKERTAHYKDVARDYYDLTTDNLEGGWTQHFHFCPFPDPDESIVAALTRHEHYLALIMGLKPGTKGLEAGCGVGSPSREILRFADVHITGVSINRQHVERAMEYAACYGLADKLSYIEVDFIIELPFSDNTFDFVYAIEATVYAPDLTKRYSEIARALKPGVCLVCMSGQ